MNIWRVLIFLVAISVSLISGYISGRQETKNIWRTKYDTLYDDYKYMENRCQDFNQEYYDTLVKYQKETAEYQNKLEAADETRSFLEEQLASAEAELALFRKKAHRK